MDYVTLDKIINDLDLEVIHSADNIHDIKITISEVNRPGLQLAGYFESFAQERLQIIGNVEWRYFDNLSNNRKLEIAEKLFSYKIPALIICRDLGIFPEILEVGKAKNKTILRTSLSTTKFINHLINYLDEALAPEITVH